MTDTAGAAHDLTGDPDGRQAIGAWIAAQRADGSRVATFRRIATGNSRANWFVQMTDGMRYVVRVEQDGVFGTASADEFRFMSAAHALGCPVAPVRWMEHTGHVAGQPFFVMDFVDGVSTGRDDRSMTVELAADFVHALDRLHRTDWSSGLARLTLDGDPSDATHAQIERWHQVYRGEAEVRIPLLDEGAAWLHANAKVPARVGIVHGDPGPGNFVHDGRRVLAFTDWEFTHLGDPTEDWAYLVTMRGSRTRTKDEWLSLFASLAGVHVSEADLHYWSAFNYFKGACANLTCRRVFRATLAPNLGIIGTALHQTYVRQLAALID